MAHGRVMFSLSVVLFAGMGCAELDEGAPVEVSADGFAGGAAGGGAQPLAAEGSLLEAPRALVEADAEQADDDVGVVKESLSQGACTLTRVQLTGYRTRMQYVSGETVYFTRVISNHVDYVEVLFETGEVGHAPLPWSEWASYGLVVSYQLKLTTEIWMGQVRQVQKQIPYIEYCSENWFAG